MEQGTHPFVFSSSSRLTTSKKTVPDGTAAKGIRRETITLYNHSKKTVPDGQQLQGRKKERLRSPRLAACIKAARNKKGNKKGNVSQEGRVHLGKVHQLAAAYLWQRRIAASTWLPQSDSIRLVLLYDRGDNIIGSERVA
eukprot:1161392-Pelagomonas_calceolata.AAC.13